MSTNEVAWSATGQLINDNDRVRLYNNPAALYIGTLGSVESRRVAISRLNRVAGILGVSDWLMIDWSRLDRQIIFLVRECMNELDASTVNGVTSMLKGVALQAWDLKLISSDAYQRIKTTKPLKVERKPRHRNVKPLEIKSMLDDHDQQASKGRIAAIRDAALLAVAYGTGARRSELVGLDIEDVNLVERTVRIRRGKGNKERNAPLPDFAADFLAAWIDVLREDIGRTEGPLFVRVRAGNQVTDARLTAQSVYEFVQRWTARLGLEPGKPHDLRASLITRLLDEGVDLSTAAAYAGHASVTTTQRYDMSAARRVAKAAAKVNL